MYDWKHWGTLPPSTTRCNNKVATPPMPQLHSPSVAALGQNRLAPFSFHLPTLSIRAGIVQTIGLLGGSGGGWVHDVGGDFTHLISDAIAGLAGLVLSVERRFLCRVCCLTATNDGPLH